MRAWRCLAVLLVFAGCASGSQSSTPAPPPPTITPAAPSPASVGSPASSPAPAPAPSPSAATASSASDWLTYQHDSARSGLIQGNYGASSTRQLWESDTLDGQIYAQPLVQGDRVIVATQNN